MISNRIVQKNNVAGGPTTNLWGWGTNSYNTIKTSAGTNISSPIMTDKFGTDNNWIMVSNGAKFTCAIDQNEKLWCWGKNDNGQLGNSTITDSSSPIQVGSGQWIKVSCGSDHVLALEKVSSKLYAWGRNDNGQLGDGTTTNRSSPVQIGNYGWLTISAGHKFSAGVTSYTSYNGRLFTWGLNDLGQLGDGTTNNRSSPVMVTYSSYAQYMWNDVVCGYNHTLATAKDSYVSYGKFFSWGGNNVGQLGAGDTTDRSTPSMWTIPSVVNLIQIEASGQNSAFIDSSYNLYMCGEGAYGQIGNNGTAYQTAPIAPNFNSGIARYVQLVAKTKGKVSTFVKTTSNTLYSWGYGDASGILGNGNLSSISLPVQIGSSTTWNKLSITGGIGVIDMFALQS